VRSLLKMNRANVREQMIWNVPKKRTQSRSSTRAVNFQSLLSASDFSSPRDSRCSQRRTLEHGDSPSWSTARTSPFEIGQLGLRTFETTSTEPFLNLISAQSLHSSSESLITWSESCLSVLWLDDDDVVGFDMRISRHRYLNMNEWAFKNRQTSK